MGPELDGDAVIQPSPLLEEPVQRGLDRRIVVGSARTARSSMPPMSLVGLVRAATAASASSNPEGR